MAAGSTAKRRRPAGPAAAKPIALALQGGGSHGAFTWGVLDRLLEDERLDIAAISGTSAGAMNAVVLAGGLADPPPGTPPREAARQALAAFWAEVHGRARFSLLQPSPLDLLMGTGGLDFSPAYLVADMLTRMVSPYDFNPLDLNPLRELLVDQVDFERLRQAGGVDLFINATNVRTGQVTVFRNDELTADMVMASACLPFLFRAVEIDGQGYWDGGYTGNPTLFPLVEGARADDIVIVQINPIARPDVPVSARDILDRLNEITFNTSLIKEVRALYQTSRLVEAGVLPAEHFRAMRLHRIHAEEAMGNLGVSSKMNTTWRFLTCLFDIGRAAADLWLEECFDKLGRETTIDVPGLYLDHREGCKGAAFL